MRNLLVGFTIAAAVSVSSGFQGARAELCAIDQVPAATLLIPHFRVDLSRCGKTKGENTLFTVLNANAAPTTAHVTVWTDWSVPTFSFNVNLFGYDLQRFNLKTLLCDGTITGAETGSNVAVNNATLKSYQQWHQGKRSDLTGNCASKRRSSDIAIGYVTVDNVQTPVSGNPSDGAFYLDHLSHTNQLIGHVYHRTYETATRVEVTSTPVKAPRIPKKATCRSKSDPKKKAACQERRKLLKKLLPLEPKVKVVDKTYQKSQGLRGYPAVHIEADDSFTGGGSANKTFYGRYVAGGTDHREPLPTTFATLYGQSRADHQYDLIVWREGGPEAAPVSCGTKPNGYPLGLTQAVAFNSDADVVEIFPKFPAETQILSDFLSLLPYNSGWVYLNLNTGLGVSQAWVIQRRDGTFDGEGVVSFGSPCVN